MSVTIDQWVYNRLSLNTTATVTPNTGQYASIPVTTYSSIGFGKNGLMRLEQKQIKNVHTTQDLCETDQETIYQLFEDADQTINAVSSNLNVETAHVINSIPSVRDEDNDAWFGIVDIEVIYWIRD